jgi:hypothetical protein
VTHPSLLNASCQTSKVYLPAKPGFPATSGGSGVQTYEVSESPGENLATAAALGQVSESATTWQIFRKIEYAAGMPQVILSAAREQAEQSDPQALQWVSPQRALRLASSIGG